MTAPLATVFLLEEVCQRWSMKPLQVGALALEERLVLSVGLDGITAETGYYEEIESGNWQRVPEEQKYLRGVYNLRPNDGWLIIKKGKHEISSLMADTPNGYIDFDDSSGIPFMGMIAVTMPEILVRREEVARFEAANGVTGEKRPAEVAVRGTPGAPARFDWDAFWIEVCRRIHEEGLPSTQAALVRALLNWFSENGSPVPDESTVKKKISPLWRKLGRSEGISDAAQDRRIGRSAA